MNNFNKVVGRVRDLIAQVEALDGPPQEGTQGDVGGRAHGDGGRADQETLSRLLERIDAFNEWGSQRDRLLALDYANRSYPPNGGAKVEPWVGEP